MPAIRILIVHPDICAAGALDTRLTALGYEVAAITSSGQEAHGMMAQAEPDLVLMDAKAGAEKQGLQAADELRRLHGVPVVFVAAEADDRELRINIELALEDQFFAISIDMLCFLGFDGYFKRLNPAWERTLGFTRKELMSRPFIEFVHPDDRERTLAQNREVRGGGQALGFENRYLCKDGSFRWFLWNAAPDSAGKVIYSVARDISARKQADDDREQLVRDLQAALAEVKALRLILPICSYCAKVRDDENYWHTVENYMAKHTNTQFSHGVCPTCMASELEPQIQRLELEEDS